MTQVDFYHLTRSSLAGALPPLLTRTLATGATALIRCPDETMVATLDAELWLTGWLPHGTATTPHPEWQPIYLTTTDEIPNGAGFLFLVDGAAISEPERFTRIFDLFDGNAAASVAAARERWRAAKTAGFAMAYWRQGEAGWEKIQ